MSLCPAVGFPATWTIRFRRLLGRVGPAGLVLFFALGAPVPLPACGPFFPNSLLRSGEDGVLIAPRVDFERELERMKLVDSRFQAVPLAAEHGQTYLDQSSDAEAADLAAALQRLKVPVDEAQEICKAHEAERQKLKDYAAAFEAWEQSGEWVWGGLDRRREKPKTPPPAFPELVFVKGLPGEFTDYFAGAMTWHNPAVQDKSLARSPWEQLLSRPENERRFKSTWAAFMLGKSWATNDPATAIAYFKQVRDLARRGFVDSVGLAAASLGLEARVELKRGNLQHALLLYLEQYATGDETALNSLRIAANTALREADAPTLARLARDAKTRQVITAYLISCRESHLETLPAVDDSVKRWLVAVEAANVVDLESAEKLALAAYRYGELDEAWRWIKRARSSPVAQWMEAKLLLHAGKLAPAAALLAQISGSFPLEDSATNRSAGLVGNLLANLNASWVAQSPAGRQVLGELGVLQLARREYVQSLDALLRSGFWEDAAYVAERVLTVSELQAYVDRTWSDGGDDRPEDPNADQDEEINPARLAEKIRYLLARRLLRLNRLAEAREYFPPAWQPQLDLLMQLLHQGWDETQPAGSRAQSLFAAAKIVRTNGMELYGTELGPDWHIHGGGFEVGVNVTDRTNASPSILSASADEVERASAPPADPEKRFHYRYQAASLAWEAAKLLPDNTDETARILCTAGSWLKYRDPQAADYFYKALVRRCRQTAIGQQADRMRWFPVLDAAGNPKPYQPRQEPPKSPTPDELSPSSPPSADVADLLNYPLPGSFYLVHPGDALPDIAAAVQKLGYSLTVQEIINANPGLTSDNLSVGQRIFIPEIKE